MKNLSGVRLLNYNQVLELLRGAEHEDLVLVGGQAVLFYAHLYKFDEIASGVSGDFDLMGSAYSAHRFASKFKSIHSFKIADFSDNTLNNALLAVNLGELGESPILVDFIANVGGLESKEVIDHALQVDISGGIIKIMHPFHLLKSKLHNLVHIPQKRTIQGVQQLELAFKIAESCFKEIVTDPVRTERAKLKAAENLFAILSSRDALTVNAVYGPVDLMKPIRSNPPDVDSFKSNRLPQMIALLNSKTKKKADFRKWQDENTQTKSEKTRLGRIKF